MALRDRSQRRNRTGIGFGNEANIHPTILDAPGFGVIVRNRLVGTKALDGKTAGGDVAHALHPVAHGGSTGVGQPKVSLSVTGIVSVRADDDQPAWPGLDIDQGVDEHFGRVRPELGTAWTEQ